MNYSSSFSITNARDFFHDVVVEEYSQFLANNSSPRHALMSMLTAYHMFEWVHQSKFEIDDFRSRYPGQDAVAEAFDAARNIANGTKHFRQKLKTRTQRGFSSGFSEGFARPLVVVLGNGIERSADSILHNIIEFWKEQEDNGAF